jgi:hypothetical protein
MTSLTRKQFLLGSAGVLSFAALGGCGDPADDDGDGGGTGGSCGAVQATIATNHGHMLEVPAADVAAGEAMTYELTTGNGHTHQVTVSVVNMERLANGESVDLLSTTDGGHQHGVTVVCS